MVDGLACQRGGRTVVSGISFEVPAGRALALRGPNGSGKTTLLRTIAGYLQPGGRGHQGKKTPSPRPSPQGERGAGCGPIRGVEGNSGVPSPRRGEGQGEGGLR